MVNRIKQSLQWVIVLSRAVELNKNADPDKYGYIGYSPIRNNRRGLNESGEGVSGDCSRSKVATCYH